MERVYPIPALVWAVLTWALILSTKNAPAQELDSLPVDSLTSFSSVRIHLYSAETMQMVGRITDSRGDSLLFVHDSERLEIARSDIHRIEVMTDEGNQAGGFVLGALLGGAVGGFVTFNAHGGDYGGAAYGISYGIPLGAVLGGMIGLASAGPTWEEVVLER